MARAHVKFTIGPLEGPKTHGEQWLYLDKPRSFPALRMTLICDQIEDDIEAKVDACSEEASDPNAPVYKQEQAYLITYLFGALKEAISDFEAARDGRYNDQ